MCSTIFITSQTTQTGSSWGLPQICYPTICRKCRYLRWIDIEGYIKCDKGHNGKEKTYCVDYEQKE